METLITLFQTMPLTDIISYGLLVFAPIMLPIIVVISFIW